MTEKLLFNGDVNLDALKRIAVSRKYKFLYNRVQKNANSHMMVVLNFLQNGRVDSVIASRNAVTHLPGMAISDISELLGYRRLLIVRSPYSRVLSAFLEKFRLERIQRKWGTYPLTPDGFGDFLGWLQKDGLEANSHWDLQTKQILLPLAAYTDVIRFEDDLGGAISRFFTDVGVDVAALTKAGLISTHGHKTDAGRQLREFYNDDRLEIVARLYTDDFKKLNYGTDPGLT